MTRSKKEKKQIEIIDNTIDLASDNGNKPKTKPISITDPKDQPVWVYTGQLPGISINNHYYERGVPSFMPYDQRGTLQDFHPYKPQEPTYNSSSQPIFVQMPIDMRYIIGSIATLYRIREYFPKCEIAVQIRDEAKKLLPGFITVLSNRNGRERFYRTFDLTESRLTQYWLTPHNEKIIPIHHLILQSTDLYDVLKDKELTVVYNEKRIDTSSEIAVYSDGSDFGKYIEKSFPNYTHNPQIVSSKYRGVVFTYDSPMIYYYLFHKIPVIAFIDRTIYHHEFQYKQYHSVELWPTPIADDYDKAVSIIDGKFTEKLIEKYIAPKREDYDAYGAESTEDVE